MMLDSAWFEIAAIAALILLNGLFAFSEIAVVSSNKARLLERSRKGEQGAATALGLAEDPDRLLSAIQVGITTIGVLSGAYGGATLARELETILSSWPALAPHAQTLSLGIVVAGVSYGFLLLGELVPKRLALRNPEGGATAVSPLMRVVSTAAYPLVKLLSLSTWVVLTVLRVRPSKRPPVTEREVTILVQQGTEAGVFEPHESRMVGKVFEFADRDARSLMVPRTEVEWIDIEEPVEEGLGAIMDSPHEYVPLARGSLDDVLGIVAARDVLRARLSGKEIDLRALMQPAPFIPETMPGLSVLGLFRERPLRMGLVIDEYGGLQGIITLHDIMRAIVGSLPVEDGGAQAPAILKRADGSWLIDGRLPVGDFKTTFGVDELPDEDEYDTVAGFVLFLLGHIPGTGERVRWKEYEIEIVDMDGMRIDKVLLYRTPGEQERKAPPE